MAVELEKFDLKVLPPSAPMKDDFQTPLQTIIEPAPEFEESTDIRDYVEIVLRRKWLILAIILVSTVSTLIVSLVMKPLYKATGKIEMSIEASRVTKFEAMTAMQNQIQTREFMQTHLKLLQSQTLADRVIDKLDLEHNPALNPKLEESGTEKSLIGSAKEGVRDFLANLFPGSTGTDPKMAELKLRKKIDDRFAKHLEVQPERDTMIFSLGFTSTNPSVAQDVINTLIDEFISWQIDKKIDATVAAKHRLEKQIEVARIQLEKAETNLNEFARKAGIVSLNRNLNLVYKQLEDANKAYSDIQTERLGKEALYSQARQSGDSLPAALETSLLQSLRSNYAAAASEYEEKNATMRDDYPTMQNLKAKMLDLGKKIKAEESRIIESLKNDYLSTVKKEEALKKDVEAKKALAMALNDQSTQYKILEREVETSKQIHESLLERSKEIDAKVGTELGNIQVVDHAKLPLKIYSPRIARNILIGALLGMILGLGLAFLLEYLDNTIKRIEELSERFHLPTLGVVPLLDTDEALKIGSLVRDNPRAGFSEAIGTVKISIQLSSSVDRPPRLLCMCSTGAGEGKSTVAVNLAQAFASEEKVLIIDADLRKPNIHRILGKEGNGASTGRKIGLSSYLTGLSEDIIQETEIPNLDVAYAGPIPPNPSELLSSNRMRQFLAEVYQRYDRVIIDGPPALGFADALILGHYADGVILVSVLGGTHREALRDFRKNLDNVGGRMIGTIVNKLSQVGHYGYYKYYKYYRYYHYQSAYYRHDPNKMPNLTSNDEKGDGPGVPVQRA